MYLRNKLTVFLLAFSLIILSFILANLFIFERIDANVAILENISQEQQLFTPFKSALADMEILTRGWLISGDEEFKGYFDKKRNRLTGAFGAFIYELHDGKPRTDIIQAFNSFDREIQRIFTTPRSTGNVSVVADMASFNSSLKNLNDHIDKLHMQYFATLADVSGKTLSVKRTLSAYLISMTTLLISVSLLLFALLKRAIQKPIDLLLRASQSVSLGRMDTRIDYERRDEFAVLANTFNAMMERIQSSEDRILQQLRLTETQLEIAQSLFESADARTSLSRVVDIISRKSDVRGIAVYRYHQPDEYFEREVLSKGHSEAFPENVSSNDPIARAIRSAPDSHFILSRSEAVESGAYPGATGALIAVPILAVDRLYGFFLAIAPEGDEIGRDVINLFSLLAHMVGTFMKNLELYWAGKSQLRRLTALYELAQSAASAMTTQELFDKVTSEMTRLLGARGCIIRIREGDILPVKSTAGVIDPASSDLDLRVGSGIAGKVVVTGDPILIEDASSLPENMQLPGVSMKSVISVPMRVSDAIVGTIGLFDKFDDQGRIVSFTQEDLETAMGFASISSSAAERIMSYERETIQKKSALDSKKRMETLFDSVRGGIITLDREGTVLLANRYVEHWVGRRQEEIIGKNSIELFHGTEDMICPHCVARATFETGDINTVTQSRGINYAELTSYPIMDDFGKVIEAVVFIQDITDRVLYQEEILSLYKEVSQTKEYLESLIANSADAIITTDLNGIITSWNEGASKIYGFSELEALGTFLPIIPDFLEEAERAYITRIKNGEIIRNLETLRCDKSGRTFEVSLTLSAIKDSAGEVIGISGISRDISEKKMVERELIRRNQELSRLFIISSAMRGTIEFKKLLRMILTAVTMSDGLGFNRALLFLVDEQKRVIRGVMGVGPASSEDAWKIWASLSNEKKTLHELLEEVESSPFLADTLLDKLSSGMLVSLDDNTTMTKAVKEKIAINVPDAHSEPLSDPVLLNQLGTSAYAVIPLVSRNVVTGVLWVDNFFNNRPITEEDIRFLRGFTDQIAAAIESARLFEKVKLAEAELENIFESISDMVYFNSPEYDIKTVNKAVLRRIGKSADEIIGKKCYEVFHGLDHPWEKCPHHKTVITRKSFVEEVEDPHLGGTFLASSSPIFDSEGTFIGTVHVVRDITELKKLREKLAMTERMAALGEVAAKVAHEIRNPLVSIGGFSRRLEKKLTGSLKDYAGIISKEVTRLEGILRDILGYVKDIRLLKEPVIVSKIVDEVMALFEAQIKNKKLRITRHYDPKLPEVEIDIDRMKEAIINIVGNAVEVLPPEGLITLRTYRDDSYVVAEISDNGPGIHDSDMPYIFDPFFTTKVSGTGLGLAITHRIVEQHNGRIEVSSVPGQGALFKIFLPAIKEVFSL